MKMQRPSWEKVAAKGILEKESQAKAAKLLLCNTDKTQRSSLPYSRIDGAAWMEYEDDLFSTEAEAQLLQLRLLQQLDDLEPI